MNKDNLFKKIQLKYKFHGSISLMYDLIWGQKFILPLKVKIKYKLKVSIK